MQQTLLVGLVQALQLHAPHQTCSQDTLCFRQISLQGGLLQGAACSFFGDVRALATCCALAVAA